MWKVQNRNDPIIKKHASCWQEHIRYSLLISNHRTLPSPPPISQNFPQLFKIPKKQRCRWDENGRNTNIEFGGSRGFMQLLETGLYSQGGSVNCIVSWCGGSYVPSQTPGQNPADFHVCSKLPFLAIKTGGSSQPIRVLYELIIAFLWYLIYPLTQ